MLEVVIVFGIFSWLMSLISKPFAKKIKNASTIDEAVKYRKRLYLLRWGFSIFFVVIYVVPPIYLNPNLDFWANGYGKYTIGAIFVYLISQNGFKELRGNISLLTKERFLDKYNSYALYLRGFNDDVYGVAVSTVEKDRFSENCFIEELESYMPACAVGMTKEMDAPYGAERVYVSDDTWKEDVLDLMMNSNKIFVLLNDRPSCIWEIEQCAEVLDKTCFLVEDIEKYNVVRSALAGIIDFPEVSATEVKVPFVLKVNDASDVNDCETNMDKTTRKKFCVINFENSDRGYKRLLSILFKRKVSVFERIGDGIVKFFYCSFAVISLFFLNIFISSNLLRLDKEREQFMMWAVVVVLCIVEWLVYMLFRVSSKKGKNNRV